MIKIVAGAAGLLLFVGIAGTQWTTISTGENGLYTSFDGKVKNEVLTPGIKYDGFGTIKVFNTRKITVGASDLRPKTQDNTVMKDMDVVITYSISPTSLFEFYTNYDMSNHGVTEGGQIQLMSSYIGRLITSAVNQSVDEFPALQVNNNLENIQDRIRDNMNVSLQKNNLNGKIQIDGVIISKADLPEDLVASVNKVVAAQSANKEQEVKTRTAQLKAEENKALASTVTEQSLDYQRNEILREAMKNGGIQKIIIINGSKMDILPGGFSDK